MYDAGKHHCPCVPFPFAKYLLEGIICTAWKRILHSSNFQPPFPPKTVTKIPKNVANREEDMDETLYVPNQLGDHQYRIVILLS